MPQLATLDPHDFNGEPHQVAAFAGEQTLGVIDFLNKQVDDFEWAARNAWMTAEFAITGEMPPAKDYAGTSQGRRFGFLRESLLNARHACAILTVASSYDPKA